MSRLMRLAAVVAVLFTLAGAGAEVTLFVAPDGDDSNPGTLESPFATLECARIALRALSGHDGATVYLRAGTYTRASTFRLGAEDSGTADAPVAFRSYRDETVRISGGCEIRDFQPVSDEDVLARLLPAAREHVLVADLRAAGITDFGKLKPRGLPQPIHPTALELFFDDQPMTPARWPNEGYAKTGKVLAPGTVKSNGNKQIDTGDDAPCGAEFIFDNDRITRWANAEDAWMHGFWCWDWADEYVRIASIDADRRTIRTATPHSYGYKEDRRFYVLNVLEELDQPGEYYVDRRRGLLYLWPEAPIESSRAVVSLIEAPLVELRDAKHVVLQGLIFEAARGDGVVIAGGTGNRISGCTFRNLGNRAAIIAGGTDNGVTDCTIHATGEGGIVISGGDRKTLTPANNYATNNEIHHSNRLTRTYRPAIRFTGVGQRVANNRIHDIPHTAILFGSANDCTIELNEIFRVCTESEDAGAIYTGRDWTIQGIVIRHNLIYDMKGRTGHGRQAIYIDDAAGGMQIIGNVISNVQRAMLIGGGRDNRIENNIIVNCDIGMHIDDRGMNWMAYHVGHGGIMPRRLAELPYRNEPWSGRYPWLVNILEDDPAVPKRNVLRNNLFVRSGNWRLADAAREHGTIGNNFETSEDPGFVNAEKHDFRLAETSAVWRKLPDFRRIPFDRIGRRASASQTSP